MEDLKRQPFRGVLRKRRSENMQQIYGKTSMPNCYFDKIALQLYWNRTSHGCSLVNLLHIFKTPFPKNTWRVASGFELLENSGGSLT